MAQLIHFVNGNGIWSLLFELFEGGSEPQHGDGLPSGEGDGDMISFSIWMSCEGLFALQIYLCCEVVTIVLMFM